ncbi:hypothetical protein BSY239_2921 [Hydrogenophaga sp. RAC07]|jgi:hypothetical protein|uniref:hypothetical protein n=1 Tax=Hydrogenophaga sp. RAC07 TaxID=1842537 RepID=UPI00083DA3DC|nr:hypothetical protein [Hydrogenophaga sp. RAC07]AOF83866.1 hypothetical protein BSY239_2921 [Hydrogenophaga sp. RAC07]
MTYVRKQIELDIGVEAVCCMMDISCASSTSGFRCALAKPLAPRSMLQVEQETALRIKEVTIDWGYRRRTSSASDWVRKHTKGGFPAPYRA